MGIVKYILDENHNPVEEPDLMKWAEYFENADRSVRQTCIGDIAADDRIEISTVFLGLDHRFYGDGLPILFETMIFSNNEKWDGKQERYCTWDEAVKGHEEMVKKVKGEL